MRSSCRSAVSKAGRLDEDEEDPRRRRRRRRRRSGSPVSHESASQADIKVCWSGG